MNTPETDAAIADGYTFNHEDLRPVIAFCQRLERDRDYALSLLASEKSMRNGIIKKSAELEIKCLKIGEVITELNQRLQDRQESFQAQLIRIEEIWRGKLVESRKDADRLYNCLLEVGVYELDNQFYVQNILAQHEELAAIG